MGEGAVVVIVIDIQKEHLIDSKEKFLYYTGTSRANVKEQDNTEKGNQP